MYIAVSNMNNSKEGLSYKKGLPIYNIPLKNTESSITISETIALKYSNVDFYHKIRTFENEKTSVIR